MNNVGALNVTARAVANVLANTYTFTSSPGGEGPYTVTANFPVGNASAFATASGIEQDAFAGLTATASVVNSGIINVHATAHASVPSFREPDLGDADSTSNYAGAGAFAEGIQQYADAGYFGDYATPEEAGLIARAIFVNTATAQLNVGALAVAVGDTASAQASAAGIRQYAGTNDDVLDAAAQVTNDGLIDVGAQATATAFGAGDSTDAFAEASATGILQVAEGHTAALALVDNAGTINVGAGAIARGLENASGTAAYASANAYALGILQNALADGDFADPVDGPTGHATAHVINGGLIDVSAVASAFAEGNAAYATLTRSALSRMPAGRPWLRPFSTTSSTVR